MVTCLQSNRSPFDPLIAVSIYEGSLEIDRTVSEKALVLTNTFRSSTTVS